MNLETKVTLLDILFIFFFFGGLNIFIFSLMYTSPVFCLGVFMVVVIMIGISEFFESVFKIRINEKTGSCFETGK